MNKLYKCLYMNKTYIYVQIKVIMTKLWGTYLSLKLRILKTDSIKLSINYKFSILISTLK